MYAGKRRTLRATIATIFSHETRDVSVFVKCDNIFRLFFWKLPKIRTSKFHKVLRQYNQCVVRSIICVLLKIYFSLQQCKNFENPLRIDKVIAMSLIQFVGRHGVEITRKCYLSGKKPCEKYFRHNFLISSCVLSIVVPHLQCKPFFTVPRFNSVTTDFF